MGNGFETSDVVLIILSNDSLDTILISNEYCNSGNCIRECEYPVSQNKYLVLLNMIRVINRKGPVGLVINNFLFYFSENITIY